jgi:hypothetical protein
MNSQRNNGLTALSNKILIAKCTEKHGRVGLIVVVKTPSVGISSAGSRLSIAKQRFLGHGACE